MDWHKLYFGRVSPQEVQVAIRDAEWQRLRLRLKGTSLETKYNELGKYLEQELHKADSPEVERLIKVRVTNYVTALSRGGLIKPSDYR